MAAIARISDNGKAQLLADHLRGTAYLACEFASVFGASQWGKAAGLLHDYGIYFLMVNTYLTLKQQFIAHRRKTDDETQDLWGHLKADSELVEKHTMEIIG